MNTIIIAVIAILLILILYQWYSQCVSKTQTAREFMSGFWNADQEGCNAKGYSGAFLYVSDPTNAASDKTRAYIVALKGGRGTINRPFDFDVKSAWVGSPLWSTINIDGEDYDILIDIDLIGGRMTWRDSSGAPIFVLGKK